MIEYVVIPIAHYDDACNAIREKTGTSDLVFSGEMGNKIRSITQETPMNPDQNYGNALEQDVRQDKTFLSNGTKKTGNLQEYSSNQIFTDNTPLVEGNTLSLKGENIQEAIYAPGVQTIIKTPLSGFGTATANDVTKGKTFTSIEGFKVEGTKEEISSPDPTPQPVENEDLKLLLENKLTVLKTSATKINAQRITGMKTLQKVDLSNCTLIAPKAFQNCTNLDTLIIRTNSVCKVVENSFNNTKIIQSGFIYVPKSLIPQYQSQWSFLDTTFFKAIEDNPNI